MADHGRLTSATLRLGGIHYWVLVLSLPGSPFYLLAPIFLGLASL